VVIEATLGNANYHERLAQSGTGENSIDRDVKIPPGKGEQVPWGLIP
jgi:hypothetical protein